MADELLTVQEAADYLKLKRSTIYALYKRGELPFIKIGKQLRITRSELEERMHREQVQLSPRSVWPRIVLAGQDDSLDLIADHVMSVQGSDTVILRAHVGSYDGLTMLYRKQVDIAVIHLWDKETRDYNLPYIKAFLPGLSAVVVRLFGRSVGFYTQKGNPKSIMGLWDLQRPEVALVNRERGSATRAFLDEKLKTMELPSFQINGYQNERTNHLAVASAVASGEGDIGLGTQAAALQISGVDFWPLQQEWYDMVFLAEREQEPFIRSVQDFVCSGEFAEALRQSEGYELVQTGRIFRV